MHLLMRTAAEGVRLVRNVRSYLNTKKSADWIKLDPTKKGRPPADAAGQNGRHPSAGRAPPARNYSLEMYNVTHDLLLDMTSHRRT